MCSILDFRRTDGSLRLPGKAGLQHLLVPLCQCPSQARAKVAIYRGAPSGHDENEPDPEPKMVWAKGPDAAPMLAVEMQFDDGSYDGCPQPPEELPVLSEGAVYKRMWRVFRPREDGSYLVPQSVVAEYKSLTLRPNVVRAFERCGYCPVSSLQTLIYVYTLNPRP